MKIVCINNYIYKYLTISKTYDVIKFNKYGNYLIIDDNGKEDWFYKECFKPLSEIRNEKIDKLLGGYESSLYK